MLISIACILDKRSKEIYFKGDPNDTEYEFGDSEILLIRITNPDWKLKIKDSGYIYRMFERGIINNEPGYDKYDLFILIVCTAGVTGILWFILSILDIMKFKRTKWDSACCVSFY